VHPDAADLPRTAALVSSTVVGHTAAAGAAIAAGQAYVSMMPGTDPGGQRVEIRNLHNDAWATALMRNGGFDPVGLQAEAGDTLAVTVIDQAGDDTTSYGEVPLFAKPRIVRTSPGMGRTDVPLNNLLLVVFSQPMDAASLPDALHLRHEGVEMPGTVLGASGGGAVLTAQFLPDGPLAPVSTYDLSVSTEARSLSGTPLEGPITVTFTTQSSRGAGEFPNLTGVYDLTSMITAANPTWGAIPGTLQLAVLTIQQLPNASGLTGTVTDSCVVHPGEAVGECGSGGSPRPITGFVVGPGRIVIRLSSYWEAEGVLDSGGIVGTFRDGVNNTGIFIAEPR
jgi:hypothetical protein